MPELEEMSISDLANQGAEAIKSDLAGEKITPEAKTVTPESKPDTAKEQPKEVSKETTPETKPEVKSAKDLMGKPKDKQAAPKTEDTGEEKVIDWKSAPAKLRKAFEQRDAEAAALRAEKQRLADEIAAIKSKPVETKADTKLLEQYQSELKNLKQTLREMDYSRSDEFKEKYVTRYNKAYEQAVGEVTQLQARVDDDGNTRPATQADFDTLRALPFGQRRQAARRMFGEDADVALGHVSRLEQLRTEAREAIENEKVNYEKTQAEKQLNEEREKQQLTGMTDQFKNEIYEAWPDLFKPAETDADISEKLKDGRAFAEAFFGGADKLPVQDRAMHKAVAMARIESWPVLARMNELKDSKIEELTKELAALRGSDPGAAGKGKQVEAKKAEDEIPSFSGITKLFNELPKD